MGEIGLVDKIEGNYVVIKMQRQEACAKCKACIAGMKEEEMTLTAENECHAKPGDYVEITLEQSNFLKAVFIMYSIPLIGFLIGIGIGSLLSVTEGVTVVIGVITMGITFLLIRSQEERFKKQNYRPKAVKVIER